ncbi:hypothetical protein ABZP36_024959 [Zizania latifolia]
MVCTGESEGLDQVQILGQAGVIPIGNEGHLNEAFDIRLEELIVLDIKFLYGCATPTIALLYQDFQDARHVKIYEVALKDKAFVEGLWSWNNLDKGASLLIPLPAPLGGVIVIGEITIFYCSATTFRALSIKQSIITAVGRVDPDGSRYLFGDNVGGLHLLVVTHEQARVKDLEIHYMGETSIASTISYIDNGVVYIGSQFGDSQLIKLNIKADVSGGFVEVLEQYMNIGPIADFCFVDLDKQGQGQLITCSGAYKDGSIRVVQNGVVATEQASVQLQGIKGLWSLKSSPNNLYDTFLVVSFINETHFLSMNMENELEETDIEGFNSKTQTLWCQSAIHDQLIQVTAKSVRLVSSTSHQLLAEWVVPEEFSVNVASANASQVLLATGGGYLVYLEIAVSCLVEVKYIQLEHEISCLDINPIGENPHYSSLAAVGMWTDISISIFLLPKFDIMRKVYLIEGIVPRSVLMCTIEEVPYLLCSLGDGHLHSFVFNKKLSDLYDTDMIPLGTEPVNLRTFVTKDRTHVFAASNRPTVIYSRDRKLLYSHVNLKEVNHVCSFKTAVFPESLAIADECGLSVQTIDDIQKLHIRTIPLNEQARRICYQEQSQTLALCSFKNYTPTEFEEHFVHLLDYQTLGILSTHILDAYEWGLCIASCSFTDDNNFYYCVGTAYVLPEETEPTKGRILVFLVEERKLQLMAEKQTKGAVYSLNAFNGKLLAAINQKVRLYKWFLRDDTAHELQAECAYHGHVLTLYTQTRGDFIVVGDMMRSISLLVYLHEESLIEEVARDRNTACMTAVEMLDNDVYIGADDCYNLFTVHKYIDAATGKGRLVVVGQYHLGDFVNRFHHGSLVMHDAGSEISEIPTVIFGTASGAIGVIASLTLDHYVFLKKLEIALAGSVKSVGNISHAEWRSFYNLRTIGDAHGFVDGDLIESFLSLEPSKMEEVARSMRVQVIQLCNIVEEMTKLHSDRHVVTEGLESQDRKFDAILEQLQEMSDESLSVILQSVPSAEISDETLSAILQCVPSAGDMARE